MAEQPHLPSATRAALSARLDRVSRSDLRALARNTSETYRAAGSTDRAIQSANEALAYAIVRMPATFASVRAALQAAQPHLGQCAPESLLDLGAGSGAATLAAMSAFASLTRPTLIDANPFMLDLGLQLVLETTHVTPMGLHADATVLPALPQADAVLASYILVELDAASLGDLVKRLLAAARALIVLVEPGTPAGFARIRQARDMLRVAGWHLAAPCPSNEACPLSPPDWCHFKVRLPRSRDHMQVKDVKVPFEDEPYSYLVATRTPRLKAPARLLRAPKITKTSVDLSLCTPHGLTTSTIEKRDELFKSARKAEPGAPWPPPPTPQD